MKLRGYFSYMIYFILALFASNVQANESCGLPDEFWDSFSKSAAPDSIKTTRSKAKITGPNREAFETIRDVQPGERLQVFIQQTAKGKVTADGTMEATYRGFDGEYFYFETFQGVRKISPSSKAIKVTGVKKFQSVPMNDRYQGVPIFEASPRHALARHEGKEVTVRIKDADVDSKFGDDVIDVTGVVVKSKDGSYVLKKNYKKLETSKEIDVLKLDESQVIESISSASKKADWTPLRTSSGQVQDPRRVRELFDEGAKVKISHRVDNRIRGEKVKETNGYFLKQGTEKLGRTYEEVVYVRTRNGDITIPLRQLDNMTTQGGTVEHLNRVDDFLR